MPIVLSPQQEAAIRAHGQKAYPQECCGFLVGVDGDETVAHAVIPAGNMRGDSPQNRYAIAPEELYAVDRAARSDGQGVVGIYHSHPDVAARPSEYDREHACPWYCYVIVSVKSGKADELRNWRLTDDASGFLEDAITIRGE